MAAETIYVGNTGMVTVSTANSNLDGTGTLSAAIITGGSSYGTLIKTVTVKAQGSLTEQGIVRLFIYDGTNTKLLTEVEIPATTQSATDPAFEMNIPLNFYLPYQWSLKASTEKSQTFNVIAEGLDISFNTTAVRPESSNYTASTGIATLTTANTNLDGSGTLATLITAGGSGYGTQIQSVKIKSQGTTTQGMIRLFLYDGSNAKLLTEIPVSATVNSATVNSFSAVYDFNGRGFALTTGWSLKATTQNSETFNIAVDGQVWTYPGLT